MERGSKDIVELKDLISRAAHHLKRTVAVAGADDNHVIEAVTLAIKNNLANFILFGDQESITKLLFNKGPEYVNHPSIKIVHSNSKVDACELTVSAVREDGADLIMKGNVSTADILRAVLNKDNGLRTGNVLSHIAVFEISTVNRFILLTDAAMNIKPSLEQKVQIVNNAVTIANSIGITTPKVAALAAVEVVNEAMEATIDAALLTQMNRRGQIKKCIVDGPLAFDNAVSELAANQKGICNEVAGKADIILVPTIEVGNALYKSFIFFAGAKVGAVVTGAKVPIVLTSRADSAENKLYSLALAVCCSGDNTFTV